MRGSKGFALVFTSLNLVTSPKHFWAVYPLLGWGLGLGLHASCTYLQKGEKYEEAFEQWHQGQSLGNIRTAAPTQNDKVSEYGV